MIRTVWWYTDLSVCCGGAPAQVHLCIDGDYAIPATLLESATVSGEDCSASYKYKLEYNDTYLPEGVDPLTTTVIQGIACGGCWEKVISVTPVALAAHLPVHDFTEEDDEATAELLLSVVNPSATKELKGFIHYNYEMHYSALGGVALGITAQLFVDGASQANTARSVYFGNSNAGSSQAQGGSSCFLPITIGPGDTVELKVVFTYSKDTFPVGASINLSFGELGFTGVAA